MSEHMLNFKFWLFSAQNYPIFAIKRHFYFLSHETNRRKQVSMKNGKRYDKFTHIKE